MAGAISQPRQGCQFLFCLMKNPLLYQSAWPESSREASERSGDLGSGVIMILLKNPLFLKIQDIKND